MADQPAEGGPDDDLAVRVVAVDTPLHQIGRAEEPGHERAGGVVVDLARRADLDDPAEVEHGQAVAPRDGLARVAGQDQGRDPALGLDAADPVAELGLVAGVEPSRRLVEDQQLRLDGQGACQFDPTSLEGREPVEALPGQAVDPHEAQDFAHPPTTLAAADPPDAQGILDVLGDRVAGPERIVLEDQADPTFLGRQGVDHPGVEVDLAVVRAIEPGDQAGERRLARARGAEHGQHLGGSDLQRCAVDDRGTVVPLDQAFQHDARHGDEVPGGVNDSAGAGPKRSPASARRATRR